MTRKILSIAIPTYKRAEWLKLCLENLLPQTELYLDEVEVTIYDNSSPDNTREVVNEFVNRGFKLNYVLNPENIGSDANIAQCFNQSGGKYVLILGDDDLFVDGSLHWLTNKLSSGEFGLVCMRSYGFDSDFRKEYPGSWGEDIEYGDSGDYLSAVGPLITLISACVVNKSLLKDTDANQFCGTNLVQVHLNLLALLASPKNLISTRYHIACKRNNSGGYNFIEVFVERLGRIIDSYQAKGLSHQAIRKFDYRMMVGYLPFYLFKQRVGGVDQSENINRLKQRYGHYSLFWVWLMPLVLMPRYLGGLWGAITTFFGRIFYGDFRRGFYFLLSKLK